MYTNMSAKKRKIDCDHGQRRSSWGSGSLTVTDDPSATSTLNEDQACEPQKRRRVTESWRSFGEILRQKKHPWIVVKSDSLYYLYCSHSQDSAKSKNGKFVSVPFTGVRPNKLMKHKTSVTHQSCADD